MDSAQQLRMPNPPLTESLKYIKKVMEETGMDLTTLARASKIDPSTLTRPANNPDHRTKLSLKTLRRVAEATGINLPVSIDPNPANGSADADLSISIYETLPEGRPLSKEDKRRLTHSILTIVKRHQSGR